MSPTVDRKYEDRLKDYVDVKERVRLFYERHPDGRLVTDRVEIWQDDGVPRVVVKALAYRTPDDPHPGVGWSWLGLPGTTPYTRGSEIENAETSSWGRAIGALGIGIDGSIASRDEVDAKAGEEHREPEPDILRDGLIGTVEKGKAPVDLELRQTPDGAAWGFKLKNGRRSYQVLAIGELAEALALIPDLATQRVQVWGTVEMIPWQKDGKEMPPYPRVNISRLEGPDWIVPAPPGEYLNAEAPTVPLFELTDDEKAAIAATLP